MEIIIILNYIIMIIMIIMIILYIISILSTWWEYEPGPLLWMVSAWGAGVWGNQTGHRQPQKSSLSPKIDPQDLQRQRESSRSLLANSCWKIAQKWRSVVFARAGRLLPEISRHRRRPGEPTSPNLEWPSYLPGLWVLIVITSLSSHCWCRHRHLYHHHIIVICCHHQPSWIHQTWPPA